ncbi:MAG TPA: PAS domain S-box protein [Spirochaetota bacterium]|nr:PAS domain S-box protein [Spirochaetota bacterium]
MKEKSRFDESGERYRLIFRNAPLGIVHFDDAGVVTDCNDVFVNIIGSSRNALVGLNMLGLPDERIVAVVKKVLVGEMGLFEGDYHSVTGGKTSTVRLIFSPIKDPDGRLTGGFGIVEDITERVRAREALEVQNAQFERANEKLQITLEELERMNEELILAQDELIRANEGLYENEQKYRALFENSPDAIFFMDERFIDCNNQACRIFAVSRDELIGRFPYEFSPELQPDGRLSRDAVEEYVEAALSGTPLSFQWRHVRGDGMQIDTEVSLARMLIRGEKRLTATVRDVTGNVEAKRRIEKSLAEKEILLKEVHHRVKNNLQVISSLLSLQSRFVRDPVDLAIFAESQNRVRSMALIHEKLYQSGDFSRIDFSGYIESMVAELRRSYGNVAGHVAFRIDVQNVHLSIKKAIPCGLIITELVSNAIKYAFPAGSSGEVRIAMHSTGPLTVLVVADNGVGFPPGLDWRKASTLGLQLVISLANQIGGAVECEFENGTSFRIEFPGK